MKLYLLPLITLCLSSESAQTNKVLIWLCLASKLVMLPLLLVKLKLAKQRCFNESEVVIEIGEYFVLLLFAFDLLTGQEVSWSIGRDEMKLVLLSMAFYKLLSLIRISDRFGFLLSSISTCLTSLLPFMICFLLSIAFFTVCNIVVGNEVDQTGIEGMGFVHKQMLDSFRNSIGDVEVPNYSESSDFS